VAVALAWALAWNLAGSPAWAAALQTPAGAAGRTPAAAATAEPAEWCRVVRVVDGDTLCVDRAGTVEKLRLLSVDTEERLAGRTDRGPNEPETVFGEECALWARDFFAAQGSPEGPARVGLLFPGGVERRDVYGRLLCHAILADGRDFNLLLVELGKSPYYTKYGHSLVRHDAFVAAQERAREGHLGIWNPASNAAATPGAPEARRPYDRLLPWWEARAEAIDSFRARHTEDPRRNVDAEDPDALAAAAGTGTVHVFGAPLRVFEERDGSLTVLFSAPDRERALRALVPAARRSAFEVHELRDTTQPFHQNYVWVSGRVRAAPPDSRPGFQLDLEQPEQWSPAGPRPRLPERDR